MPRGRPPSAKTLVDRQLGRNVKSPILPAGDGYIVPNHSGDHSAGTTRTPVNDLDIANKKYVDDNVGSSGFTVTDDGTFIVVAFGGTNWFKIRKSDKQFFGGAGYNTDETI